MENTQLSKSELKIKANNLPLSPGVYIMKDINDKIIYIGKAKILRNRVSQYFQDSDNHSEKVKKMVSNISNFEYIITDSEFEALILECNLIKYHKPKYNILLKDDKGYSYIKITNEKWPKIIAARQKIDDGGKYFGPYLNSFAINRAIDEISDIFKLPLCNKNFSKRYQRPCLNYHINKCCAPCFRNISHEDYLKLIKEAELFISKGSQEILDYLNKKMLAYANNLNFEQAAKIRDRIKAIKTIKNKQKFVSTKYKEQDVIALASDSQNISVEIFRFSNGNIYETKNFIFDILNNDIIKSRTDFVKSFYSMSDKIAENIFLDGDIEDIELIKKWLENKFNKKINFKIPRTGEQFKIVELCRTNAYELLMKRKNLKGDFKIALEALQKVLNLKTIPNYIEAYDISNLFGGDNVGGMVVFKDGYPLKSGYRRFKIQGIVGQDDYGSMREVIGRRLKKYIENNENSGFDRLPDLILLDGGIAHVNAVREVLREYQINIPTFGMVKDNRHRTKALTNDIHEIKIKDNYILFSLITRIQDEVHRYTINYHKKLRNKRLNNTELTKINTIGNKKANILLKHFGSIKNLSNATIEELILIPGINKSNALEIIDYFNNKQ